MSHVPYSEWCGVDVSHRRPDPRNRTPRAALLPRCPWGSVWVTMTTEGWEVEAAVPRDEMVRLPHHSRHCAPPWPPLVVSVPSQHRQTGGDSQGGWVIAPGGWLKDRRHPQAWDSTALTPACPLPRGLPGPNPACGFEDIWRDVARKVTLDPCGDSSCRA